MSPDTRTELHERADDYVFGLLDAHEAASLEAEMESDAALRNAVAESRDRFLELDLAGPLRPVSSDLWQRIDATLPELPAALVPQIMASPPAANDNRLARWKRAALAGIAASLMLAAGLGYSLFSAAQPQVIAVLVNDAGVPLVLVEDFGNASAKITPIADFVVPADRSMQVWTLPSKEMGPTSLGLLDGWHTAVLGGPALPAPKEEQLYEITLEQPGGSPTGRPTGPILVKGFAKVPR